MGTELALRDVKELAVAMAGGKLFGKTSEELVPLMLIAQAEGRNPVLVAQEYDVIQGRPAMNARTMQARFQAAGGSIRWVERSNKRAELWLSHPQSGELTIVWDEAKATAAELWGKAMWKKYPEAMLANRAMAEGVRAALPGCLSGAAYTPEEVADGNLEEDLVHAEDQVTTPSTRPAREAAPAVAAEAPVAEKPEPAVATLEVDPQAEAFMKLSRPEAISKLVELFQNNLFTDSERSEFKVAVKAIKAPADLYAYYAKWQSVGTQRLDEQEKMKAQLTPANAALVNKLGATIDAISTERATAGAEVQDVPAGPPPAPAPAEQNELGIY